MDQNNQTFVKQHFHKNGHDLNRDAKFAIIDIIQKDIDIKPMIEKKRRQIDKKSKNIYAIRISYKSYSPNLGRIKIWSQRTPMQTNKAE